MITVTASAVFAASSTAYTADNPSGSSDEALGQPDGIGYLVSDLTAVENQLQNATGMQFGSTTVKEVPVKLAGRSGTQTVTLKSAITRTTQPSVEIVEAHPAPPQTSPDRVIPFLSYSVSNISQAGVQLQRAGFQPAVTSAHFSIWRGKGGIFVRLTDESTPGSTSDPRPAALSLYPCDIDGVKAQLSSALGVQWSDPQTFTLPWTLADGTVNSHTSTSMVTLSGGPFLALEPPHGFPGEDACSADYTPNYLVFAADDVTQAEQRLTDAGMTPIAQVPGLLGAYRGTNGMSVEIASPSFLPAQ